MEISKSYSQALSNLSDTMSALAGPHSDQPLKFQINNLTFTTIQGTDDVICEEDKTVYHPTDFLKKVFPVYRPLYKKIEYPKELLLVGNTSRIRILRAVQAHYDHPTITDTTKLLTPYFQYYLNDSEGMSRIGSQYRATLWANGYDYELASAHFADFGYITPPRDKIQGASMHKIAVTEEGITLEVSYPSSFEERLHKACTNASLEFMNQLLGGRKPTYSDIQGQIMRTFYYSDGHFCSVKPEYRETIINLIHPYINKMLDGIHPDLSPPLPAINEPEELLPPQGPYLLRWEDFHLTNGATKREYRRNIDNNRLSCLHTLQKKCGHLDPEKEYKAAELGITQSCRSAGVKYGFLLQIGAARNTRYKLNLKEE